MPPYLYGCERTPYSARPDVVAADRVGNWERMLHQKRTPCSWIAPAQRAETDAFYMVGAGLAAAWFGVFLHRVRGAAALATPLWVGGRPLITRLAV